MLSCSVCRSVLSVWYIVAKRFDDQDETWHAGTPRPWPHCVRWRPSSPYLKGHSPPNFRPISVVAKWLYGLRCHLVWMWYRPRPRRLCVRWGPSSTSQKGDRAFRQFTVHVYCGQTAGWLKIALGMEASLGPGHIVLDGDPAPSPKKGQRPPIFGPFLLWQTVGCIKMPVGMKVGLGPGDYVLDGDLAPRPP